MLRFLKSVRGFCVLHVVRKWKCENHQDIWRKFARWNGKSCTRISHPFPCRCFQWMAIVDIPHDLWADSFYIVTRNSHPMNMWLVSVLIRHQRQMQNLHILIFGWNRTLHAIRMIMYEETRMPKFSPLLHHCQMVFVRVFHLFHLILLVFSNFSRLSQLLPINLSFFSMPRPHHVKCVVRFPFRKSNIVRPRMFALKIEYISQFTKFIVNI